MNYEKAYNEALETARKINNGDGVAAPADWTVCETIFPVLREDYDERMINRIIDLIKEIGEDDSYHVYHYDDMLAWLEKQKSIDVLDKEEREFADNVDAFRKEIDAAYQRGYEEGKRQSKCKFSVGDIVKHSLYDGLYYIVKSIDLAGDYELECLNGKSGNNIASATEEYLSLWTIKDAKPGDVLTDGDMFVIFKSNNYDPNTQYGCMFVYCSIMKNNGGWHEFWYESGGLNPTDYLPATKKQRRYFFKRMEDAGYEWNIGKLDLRKKTKQEDEKIRKELIAFLRYYHFGQGDSRPFNEDWISWLEKQDKNNMGISEATKQKLEDNLNKALEKETPESWNKFLDEQDELDKESEDEKIRQFLIHEVAETSDKVMSYRNMNKKAILAYLEKQGEQKPAWNDEDEKMLEDIKYNFEFNKEKMSNALIVQYDRFFDKVKSLKPQPKQEWKQENTDDLTDFENAMMHIGGSFFGDNAGLDPNDTKTIKEQANLLLELVPKQEWSKEDDYYYGIIQYILNNECVGRADKEIAINWFKFLKERYTWKPSDEQMEMLENVRKILHTNEDIYSKANHFMYNFEELIRTLKKLRNESYRTYQETC